jgi:hypothetical protein
MARGTWDAVKGLLWLMAAILCITAGAGLKPYALPSAQGRIQYRFANEAPSFSDLEAVKKQMAKTSQEGSAQGSLTAWSQTSRSEARCDQTGASLTVDVLWIDGPASGIWPWQAVCGSLPVMSSEKICALDVQSANLLFGSTNILGQKIEVDGVSLTVACVYKAVDGIGAWGTDNGRGLLLCPAQALSSPPAIQAMDFTVFPKDGQSASEWAESWLGAGGMSAPAQVMSEPERLLASATAFAMLVLILCIVLPLIKAALSLFHLGASRCQAVFADRQAPRRLGWRQLSLYSMAAIALLGLAWFLAALPRMTFDIPPSYLPTRWSDLTFWQTLASKLAQQNADHAMAGVLRPDLVREHLMNLSGILSLAAAVFVLFSFHALGKSAKANPSPIITAGLLLAAIAFVPLSMLAVRQLGFSPIVPRGLIVLCPIFVAVSQLSVFKTGKLLTNPSDYKIKEELP